MFSPKYSNASGFVDEEVRLKAMICLQAKKAAEQIVQVEKELEEAVERETRIKELRRKQKEYEEMRIAEKYKKRLDIKPDPEQPTQNRRPVDRADRWPNDKWEELHGPNRSRWRERDDYYRRDNRRGYERREFVVAFRRMLCIFCNSLADHHAHHLDADAHARRPARRSSAVAHCVKAKIHSRRRNAKRRKGVRKKRRNAKKSRAHASVRRWLCRLRIGELL